MFPVIAELMELPVEGVGALYVAPIRALLSRVGDRRGGVQAGLLAVSAVSGFVPV